MGLFDLFKRRPRLPHVIHRLVWFELQVAPSAFRFAIIPQQPLLIGFAGEGGERGTTLTFRRDDSPDAFDAIVEEVDGLIRQLDLRSLPSHEAHLAFTSSTLKRPSLHLRFSHADGQRWASTYSLDHLPRSIVSFTSACQAVGRRLTAQTPSRSRAGTDTFQDVETRSVQATPAAAAAVLKLKIGRSGKILINGHAASLAELREGLEALQRAAGEVWYFREESPPEAPGDSHAVIRDVLDEITRRNLPVRLRETGF